jgi:hypothetical protein
VTAYIDHVPDQDDGAADRLQPRIAAAIVDVFVYVVVLNLFVEYLPQVISETFTLSLLTAVLLKGVLEIVVAAKNRVKARFRQASTPIGKVVAAVLLWVVLFGSKFLVLEGRRPGLPRPGQPGRLLLGDRADPSPAGVPGGRPPPAPTTPLTCPELASEHKNAGYARDDLAIA